MLQILLGPDDYSKREYVKKKVAEKNADSGQCFTLEDFYQGENSGAGGDLFGKEKIFILHALLSELLKKDFNFEKIAEGKTLFMALEEKLDKRLNSVKKLLANKKILVKEFVLPRGGELNDWIASRAQELGSKIENAAVEKLAVKLGRDEAKIIKAGGKIISSEEQYNLWQAENELKKLINLADGKSITSEMVDSLSVGYEDADALKFMDIVAQKKSAEALGLLEKLLRGQAGDEKTAILQLNSLLSEQFRSMLMMKDFEKRGIPEQEIQKITGWKSGRVFMVKKISSKFDTRTLKESINKLSYLDAEIKTSGAPQGVILNLITCQLL